MVVGSVSAVVSAVVGVFAVIRSQSFAGHALTDVATTGGSAAYFYGVAPLAGFIGGGLIGAGAMEVAGVQRARSRDVATGIVLGAATGVAALFLYLDTTTTATTGATQQFLFGSIFTVEPSTIPVVSILSALTVTGLAVMHRPLVLGSLSPNWRRPAASAPGGSAWPSWPPWRWLSACRRSPSARSSRPPSSSVRRRRRCGSRDR